MCNYDAKMLEEYISICEEKGYGKPSIYQNQYNSLYRRAEEGILPLVRNHGMQFYAYRSVGGATGGGRLTKMFPLV
jgi:aflatoxin B1 aldehyde reductase